MVSNLQKLGFVRWRVVVLCLLLQGIPFVLCAQEESYRVKWNFEGSKPLSVDSLGSEYMLDGGERESVGAPVYHYANYPAIGSAGMEPYLVNVQYEPLPLSLYAMPEWLFSYVEPRVECRVARGERMLLVQLPAFREKQHSLEYLVGYTVGWRSAVRGGGRVRGPMNYGGASESVLSRGYWHKVSVDASAVYRLDYEELQAMGFADPSRVSVWGAGGRSGQLSYDNSDAWVDDLQQYPLQWVHPEGVVSPDKGSYALVYLPGPHVWDWSMQHGMYMYREHELEDRAYYFLTDSRPVHYVREQGASTVVHSHVQDSYVGCVGYVGGNVCLAKSGREFFGESFSFTSTKEIGSGFRHSVSGTQAKVFVRAAASSFSPSEFDVMYEGVSQGTLKMSSLSRAEMKVRLAEVSEKVFSIPVQEDGDFSLTLSYSKPTVAAEGWLSRLFFNVRQELVYEGKQLLFSIDSVAPSATSQVIVKGDLTQGERLWDVTHVLEPYDCGVAGELPWVDASRRGWAVVFSPAEAPHVRSEGQVANQNLHALPVPELLIVTAPAFLSQVERIANIYRASPLSGVRVEVVTLEQVYNEFSSGSIDPTAIRNLARMFYWRGGGPKGSFKYLLLMGKAFYDYRLEERNASWYLPNFQTQNSWNTGQSYGSDDYYGMLDANEGHGEGEMDIAVGRYSVKDVAFAQRIADHEAEYHSFSAWGPWLLHAAFVADDADGNVYMEGSDSIVRHIEKAREAIVVRRLYADAFTQEMNWYSSHYLTATRAIQATVQQGVFLFNYIGHGGFYNLGQEGILTRMDFNQWRNGAKRPIFVAASCYLAQYDNSDLWYSLGERLLFLEGGGAIASVASSRVSYSQSNFDFNFRLLEAMYPFSGTPSHTLGEAVARGKQKTVNPINKRKYVLLGNPALPLLDPKAQVKVVGLNGKPLHGLQDTVRAGSMVDLELETTVNGNPLSGRVYVLVRGPKQRIQTLNNDSFEPFSYEDRLALLFNGQTEAKEGKAHIQFRVPLDADVAFGAGLISLVGIAEDAVASGAYSNFTVGGRVSTKDLPHDTEGPSMRIYLDGQDAQQGEELEVPLDVDLRIMLTDSAGINTTGLWTAHDIVATLIHKATGREDKICLNDFYRADVNTYQRGEVNYRLSKLQEGHYALRIRASDALNNSTEQEVLFRVSSSGQKLLVRALNYPNPFTRGTNFYYETEQPNHEIMVRIEIYSVDATLVRVLRYSGEETPGLAQLDCPSTLVGPFYWDGLDAWGHPVGRGVYFYRIMVDNGVSKFARETQAEYFGKLLKL